MNDNQGNKRPSEVNTEGGAYVGESITVHGDFVGRDKITNNISNYYGFTDTKSDQDILPDPDIEVLPRIRSGQQLLSILYGVDYLRFEQDQPRNSREAHVLSSISTQIQDLCDLSVDFAAGDIVQIGFHLNDMVNRFEEEGFWLFGHQTRRAHPNMNTGKKFLMGIIRIAHKDDCAKIAEQFEKIIKQSG
jgi:hypothetical protein